jgi:hypothetical protein
LFNLNSKTKDGYQHHCKQCKLEYQRNNPNRKAVSAKYREANKELCSARSVASQKKKREYYNARMREWAAANHAHLLQLRRAWYAKNSAEDIARVRRRTGKIREAEKRLSLAERVEIQGLYDFCRIFPGFEVDHIVPLNGKTVSGLHVPANLQVLPRSVNRSKSNKFVAGATA